MAARLAESRPMDRRLLGSWREAGRDVVTIAKPKKKKKWRGESGERQAEAATLRSPRASPPRAQAGRSQAEPCQAGGLGGNVAAGSGSGSEEV